MPASGDLLPSEIKARLATRVFGRRVYYLPETDSTNRVAIALAREGEPHGTLVVADYQTGGKGRWNRRWESARGRNLLFSLILRPDAAAGKTLPLTLALSLGVAEAVGLVTERKTGVKWPNDVIIEGRKIAGILSEGSIRGPRAAFVVAGIGVNVNATAGEFGDEFRDRACSCRTLTGLDWNRAEVLARLLLAMEPVYDTFVRDGFEALAGRYKGVLTVWRREVRFQRAGEECVGTVTDVSPDGGLVVDSGSGPVTLYDVDVSILRGEGKR